MATSQSSPLLDECETEVRAQLAMIAARRADKSIGFDRDMAMATAALTRALVSAESERRQRAKATAREVSSIPIEQIVSHLKALPEDQRAEIARDITGADDLEPLI